MPTQTPLPSAANMLSVQSSLSGQPIFRPDHCHVLRPFGHCRRFACAFAHRPSRIHLPIPLPYPRLMLTAALAHTSVGLRRGLLPSAMSLPSDNEAITPKMPTRYYQDSDSCGRHHGRRSPRFTHPHVLDVPPPTTRTARSSLSSPTQRDQSLPDFAFSQPARRRSPPNRVRHPTDRQFASGCFPPRIAATQLPSTTGPWPTPTRTSTVLCGCACGRTGSRLCRRSFRRPPAIDRGLGRPRWPKASQSGIKSGMRPSIERIRFSPRPPRLRV